MSKELYQVAVGMDGNYLLGEKDCDRIDVILTALSSNGEGTEFNNSRKAKFVRKKQDKLIRILEAVDSCLEDN